MNTEIIKQYIPEGSSFEISGNVALFEVPAAEIKKMVGGLRAKKLPLKLITATDDRAAEGCFRIWYILGIPKENAYIVPYIRLKDTLEFPSLASSMHEAWDYERKIKTFFGLTPTGHHDQRPIILHEQWPTDIFPLRKDFDGHTRPAPAAGTYPFQEVKGEGIYEVSVGPVHAGIIEPGHFRISVAGEMMVLLEPRLGYTHKGNEKLFESLPLDDKIRLSEKISGDSSFGHSLVFCQALEQLSGITVAKRARYLRLVFAELERLANHLGDIGAIMLDAGYNFGGANGARLRETVMRMNERLTGSRFLRGVNTVGGVKKGISPDEADRLSTDIEGLVEDFTEIIDVAQNSASLLNRLKGTGILNPKIARASGALGLAAKALGIPMDARMDFPYAAYGELPLDRVETEESGDVYARFRVRVKEVYASAKLIREALGRLPAETGEIPSAAVFRKNAVAVSCVEGWRGEIVYFVATDANGAIARVAPRDPSFINWSLLKTAGTDNIIPDFPLINKSFNLSYSGNDL